MTQPHGRITRRRPPIIRRGKSERRAEIRRRIPDQQPDYMAWCLRFGTSLTYQQWQHAHMREPFERGEKAP